jgi:hypothetical protein
MALASWIRSVSSSSPGWTDDQPFCNMMFDCNKDDSVFVGLDLAIEFSQYSPESSGWE